MTNNIKKIIIFAIATFIVFLSVLFLACNNIQEYNLMIPEGVIVTRSDFELTSQDKIKAGEELAISYSLSTGYEVEEFKVNGADFINGSLYIVDSDVVIHFKQKKINYTITKADYYHGALSIADSAYYGDIVTVTLLPETGYRLKILKANDVTVTQISNNIATFAMPAENIILFAEFEKITKKFDYNYNDATANKCETDILIEYETFQQTVFIVPEKEYFTFGGWYLDKDLKRQISDANGNLTIGYEIFENPADCLYAKWIVIEEITYKVLLVFVDEIRAILETAEGEICEVNYKMSAYERQLCETIAEKFTLYINELMGGLVTFEVDSYFTTIPLETEAFTAGLKGDKFDYKIFANDIPEISGLLDNYRSIITSVSLNDYDFKFGGGGSGTRKYACVRFDGYAISTVIYWDDFIGNLYVHELTHTFEQGMDVYEYHDLLYYYNDLGISDSEATKLYLLNRAEVNGEAVGIPYIFWEGEYKITLPDLPEGVSFTRNRKTLSSGDTIYYGDILYIEIANIDKCELNIEGNGFISQESVYRTTDSKGEVVFNYTALYIVKDSDVEINLFLKE